MNKYFPGAFLMVGLVASVVAAGTAQERDERFVAWAKAGAKPIDGVELKEDLADLRPLQKIIGQARVVSLGEPEAHARSFCVQIRFVDDGLGFLDLDELNPGFTRHFDVSTDLICLRP